MLLVDRLKASFLELNFIVPKSKVVANDLRITSI